MKLICIITPIKYFFYPFQDFKIIPSLVSGNFRTDFLKKQIKQLFLYSSELDAINYLLLPRNSSTFLSKIFPQDSVKKALFSRFSMPDSQLHPS
jgi:hypothetical protein